MRFDVADRCIALQVRDSLCVLKPSDSFHPRVACKSTIGVRVSQIMLLVPATKTESGCCPVGNFAAIFQPRRDD